MTTKERINFGLVVFFYLVGVFTVAYNAAIWAWQLGGCIADKIEDWRERKTNKELTNETV